MKFSTKVQQTERNIKYIWIFPRDHIHSNLQTNTNIDARRAKLMYNLVPDTLLSEDSLKNRPFYFILQVACCTFVTNIER